LRKFMEFPTGGSSARPPGFGDPGR